MLRILTSTLPAFLAGGLIGPPLAASTSPLAAAFLAVALGTSLAVLARRVGASESHPAVVATAALVGFLHTLPPSPQPIHGIDEPMCELRGRITHRMDGRFGTRVIVGEAAARALTDDDALRAVGRVIVSTSGPLPEEFDRHVEIRARGRLLSGNNDTLLFNAESVTGADGSPAAAVHGLRARVAARIAERLREREVSDLAQALLCGRPLDARNGAVLREAGVLHLFVVSGLHLAVVALVLSRIPPFRGRRIGPGVFLPALVVTCYAVFTGLRPPVLRALAAVWLMTLARSRHRTVDGGWIVLVVGSLQLAAAPEMARDASFLLSITAVAGIAFLARPWRTRRRGDPLEDFLARKTSGGFTGALRSALVISWTATMATAPTALALFGRASVASVLTSPLLAPLAGVFATTTLVALVEERAAAAPRLLGASLLSVAHQLGCEVESSGTPLGLSAHVTLLLTAAILAHAERLDLRLRRAATVVLPGVGLAISAWS